MRITNNYQPNFKAGVITRQASELMAKRMDSGKFIALMEKFERTFKDSKFKVTLDVANGKSRRLDAMISFNAGKKYGCYDEFFRYIEEGSLSSIFRSPEKFVNKLIKTYKESAVPFENNGFRLFG